MDIYVKCYDNYKYDEKVYDDVDELINSITSEDYEDDEDDEDENDEEYVCSIDSIEELYIKPHYYNEKFMGFNIYKKSQQLLDMEEFASMFNSANINLNDLTYEKFRKDVEKDIEVRRKAGDEVDGIVEEFDLICQEIDANQFNKEYTEPILLETYNEELTAQKELKIINDKIIEGSLAYTCYGNHSVER